MPARCPAPRKSDFVKFKTNPIGKTALRVPSLGFGGAPLGGLFDAVDTDEAAATLSAAFDNGMTYVDTAPFYGFGRSERSVGDRLRGRNYTLSTKVGRLLRPGAAADPGAMGWPDALPFHPEYDYSYDGIMRSFEASQQRMGLNRIDILYVHDIGEMTHGADAKAHQKQLAGSGYKALAELRHSGQIKAIGLGVNETRACLDALNYGDWDVFLLAGRYTLLEQHALADLMPKCLAQAVSIIVGGPYNSGILVGGETWNYGAVPEQVRDRVNRLRAACQEFDIPLPAAALQFPMGHKAVASVIPGLRNQRELADTLLWATTDIPNEFWQVLKQRDLLHPEAPTPGNHPFAEAASD